MFIRLHVENFQSWLEGEIEFGKINFITGESDQGKSAIMRALDMVAYNSLTGTGFINDKQDKNLCIVELTTKNACISRLRSESINSYLIETEDSEQEIKGMGQNVPDEVQKILNMGEINIQRQEDSFFLFDKSPGEVGRYLNTITNLDVTDNSITHAKSRTVSLSGDKTHVEKEIEELIEKLESQIWVVEADKMLSEIEQLNTDIENNTNKYNRLSLITDTLIVIEKKRNDLMPIADLKNNLDSIVKLVDSIADNSSRKIKLERLIKQGKSLQSDKSLYSAIERLKVDFNAVERLKIDYNKNSVRYSSIENLVNSIDGFKKESISIQLHLDSIEKEFSTIKPNSCPMCGSKKRITL